MVTYELPCTHDKHSQIVRQKSVFGCSEIEMTVLLTVTHITDLCGVKHECLCSMLSIDVVPTLLFF